MEHMQSVVSERGGIILQPPLWPQLLLQVILIAINAYFAATEIAVISLNEAVIRHQAEEGDKKAARLLHIVEQPTGFLSTIQIGITLAGFLGSAFAADNLAGRLSQWFAAQYALTAAAEAAVHTLSVILITIVLSFFTLVFGELVPKRVAMKKSEQVARFTCGVVAFLAAVMRALGDSKSALYFLMVSSVLNIGGDLFFVKVLSWGSEGCALSTVLSEAMCCLLCAIYIKYKVPILCLGRRWLVFDGKLLKKIVSYGWASAMQQATVQMGKIAVQGIVNTMGVNTMAAFAAASRIDDFAYTPQQNIAHAMTTLMAQNRGAGKKDRVKEGFRCGIRIELVYAAGLTVVCFFGAEGIMRMFAEEPEVIELGARFLRLISLMYFLPALTNGIQGFFRGIGDLKITLRSSMLSMAARVPSAALLVLYFHMEIEALPWSYAFGWFLMLAYEVPPMLRFLRSGTMENE